MAGGIAVFDTPEEFDITRTPNDHMAFGFGSHFCLGNRLARMELSVMFDRLLDRLPDLALADAYQLPPTTVEYLHQLVGRAHNQMYRGRGFNFAAWLRGDSQPGRAVRKYYPCLNPFLTIQAVDSEWGKK